MFPRDTTTPRFRRLAQAALHFAVVTCAIILWAWHLGHLAAQQPIAQKWGWFFNYLTFWTLSLQALQFLLSLPIDLCPNKLVSLRRIVDDVACAIFSLVLFVSFSYYLISYLPLKPLYGEDYQPVPPWVPHGLHVGNSVAAVLDLLACLEQRTFSKRAEKIKTIFCLIYVSWLLLVRYVTGIFAYPFMQDLPLPWGLGCAAVFMLTACQLLFELGRRIHVVHVIEGRRQQVVSARPHQN